MATAVELTSSTLNGNGVTQLPADEIAISVRDVGKMYMLYDKPQDRLKQALFWRLGKNYGHPFWALRDVSFAVKRGESVGIIGRNGSGKSTLLQIIAGTLQPTAGSVEVKGRVAALLELGSGFNSEYTGRENVFMNGAILGLSQAEMEARFDDIAAFADIGEFLEQPIKLYSSGMLMRLAFAVQVCVNPHILIVDEALAVGDLFFRQKCHQYIEALRTAGTSFLFVSHSMMEIEQFCDSALVLYRGEMLFYGPASEATKHYLIIEQNERALQKPRLPQSSLENLVSGDSSNRHFDTAIKLEQQAFFDLSTVSQITNGWARCVEVALCNNQGQPSRIFQQGEEAVFYYTFDVLHDIQIPIGGLVIHNDRGVLVHGKSTLEYGSSVPFVVKSGERLRFRHVLTLELAMGEYTFEPGLATIDVGDYQRGGGYSYTELHALITRLCHLPKAGYFVITSPTNHRPIQLTHHGVANLPGGCQLF